ncbi:hypothetical protein V502_02443 [Pseudogymnoascus sp. VKM F-4520 (FW-2644)]|nr:hypothetical protein V502_02443 [Pseudogymnoascus sp. VKM F-4520 (FW-2644)]
MRETSMIDWHGSIGRHGPSGACPSHLHEDLADGGILNRKPPLRRRNDDTALHAALLYGIDPFYGLDLCRVVWYEPGKMSAITPHGG